jgi:microsomal dipeptidase-like Zn-dependent dipeptidase
MNRREFFAKLMRYGLSAGALSALPVERLFAQEFNPQFTIPIINAHAHIPEDINPPSENPEVYDFPTIRAANLCAISIAVLGDRKSGGGPYANALAGIKIVTGFESDGLVKIVRRPSDIPLQPNAKGPIPIILAIEGGDAIGKDLNRLEKFYNMGVRMITLVHGTFSVPGDNQIGKDMRRHPSNVDDPGLSDFGHQVVHRMNRLGMIVDVAHASAQTLFDVASCTRAPIIDSHTSMLPPTVTERIAGRQRLYSEAEAIVETGGVVCTYPIEDASLPPDYVRLTLADWVEEIKLFKSHFGMRHIGLGTDSGGGLPFFVNEWCDITSVGLLEDAMRSDGLGTLEISAFMSLNFLRVFTRCHLVGQALSFFKA